MSANPQKITRIYKAAATILLIGGIMAMLQYFKNFLQPFVIALILWFLIVELRKPLRKVKIKGKGLPKVLATFLSSVLIFLFFYLFIDIIIVNLERLSVNMPEYGTNLVNLLEKLQSSLGINIESAVNFKSISEIVKGQEGAIMSSASVAAQTLATVIGQLVLVLLYVIFLLLEENSLIKKLDIIVGKSKNKPMLEKAIPRIQHLFSTYLSVKILTSFLTGLLSFIALRLFEVDLAAMWAFIIFIFNFIPNVGSMLATSFPVLFSLIQFGDFQKAFFILVAIGGIQLLIGNFAEPRLMGNRMHLSPLIVFMGLVFWGFIWGFIGMILSVPLNAMLMIIFSQFKSTENVAIIFSQDGRIDHLLPKASEED